MKKRLLIHHDCIEIPAILWGNSLDRLIIAVHGDMSNKEDKVIELLAESAISKNYSVLSFDLPEHGDRKNNHDYECNPSHCVSDLRAVYSYVSALSAEIDLFACSIGVYFSLLALHGEKPIRSVVSHSGQNHAQSAASRASGHRTEQNVDRRFVA